MTNQDLDRLLNAVDFDDPGELAVTVRELVPTLVEEYRMARDRLDNIVKHSCDLLEQVWNEKREDSSKG